MKRHILQAHRILMQIGTEKSYSNIAFSKEDVSDMATLLVYGVLENYIRTEYIIDSLTVRKPQNSLLVLLRIGVFALENLSDVPKFAIVSECVESAKALGKSGASGFINAILKKVADCKYKLPDKDDKNYLSVTYSKPQWFIDKLQEQYGYEVMLQIVTARANRLEHIRVNSKLSDIDSVAEELKSAGQDVKRSDVGGLIVRGTDYVNGLFNKGVVTYQSPSSMLAVQALEPKDGERVLDMCSAPGGKAVYIAELFEKGEVIACELHPHRIRLIEKYAKRMRAENVKTVRHDSTVFNSSWANAFDRVLVDAPCSCFGTFLKHPDVFLSRGENEIKLLAETQKKIIANAAKYVKAGGMLVYSTCTLFKEENSEVVNALLKNRDFELQHIRAVENIDGGRYKDNTGSVQILPHNEYDGFYIAGLRKL